MAHYRAEVLWERAEQPFLDNRYSREHRLRFDGGLDIAGSSSPHVVPLPYSSEHAVDPEEAFVAALSSCHMLWFLSLAVEQGWRVDRYHDHAEGRMGRNAQKRMAMTVVTLRPEVQWSGSTLPTPEQVMALHHRAHEECFIANSVTTDVRCEPILGA